MATGSLDANGIWLYGEDDSEATASALLNKLGNSISDKFDNGLPVANGGTGAKTVAGAKTDLGIPYSIAAGSVLTSTGGLTTVTLPAGRFSVSPRITAEVTDHPNVSLSYVRNITSTNFQISAYTIAGGIVAATCHWQAVQMTSSNASG